MQTKHVEVSVPQYKIKPQATLDFIQRKAQELYEIEAELSAEEAEHKAYVAPLEAAKETKRAELLALMQEARQKHVDVDEGHFFTKEVRSSFEVTDEESAMKWAKKQGLLRLDKVQANKVLLRLIKTPKGFVQVDKPYLKLNVAKNQ